MVEESMKLFAETLPVAVEDQGSGRPYLLLHGGFGPRSMVGLAGALASTGRTILPTHPGFDGRPRPSWFHRIDDLALAYLTLLERLGLDDTVLVGNSVGGWIAAEMGLRASPRVAAVVLINAVGLAPTPGGDGIVDPAPLAPAERSALSFHDPARYAVTPAGPEALATMAANQQALRAYAGEPFMHDPGLRARLPDLKLPTLVLWGESDRIVTPTYGRQFSDAIPDARFELVSQAGHFPQIEQLNEVVALIKGLARHG